jgi:hypothetical protein
MQSAVQLRDRRLASRLDRISQAVEANPSWSFPQLFPRSADLEAAYRFFGNPTVTPQAILSKHFADVRSAASQAETVLVIHDTSTFSFAPEGQRSGLGRARTSGQAFFGHFALVVSDDNTRRPLGVADFKTWVRGEGYSDERARWFELIASSTNRLAETSAIHVMDREADDYLLFCQLVASRHRFIIRLTHDRLLTTEGKSKSKLSQAIAQLRCDVERQVRLSKRIDGKRSPIQKQVHPSRSARTATLAIGATTVALAKPRKHPRDSEQKRAFNMPESLRLNVVQVWEPHPPNNEPPVQWTLVTTESIEQAEDLVRIVDRYRARWTIEEYFKALKTGCSFKKRQLGDYEGLINALAVFMPIASRMLWMRSCAQRAPNASAATVISPDELEVLRTAGTIALPEHPSARDVLFAVAALGGHIRWNGEPGWQTISRGFQSLLMLTQGWRLAKLQQFRDQ